MPRHGPISPRSDSATNQCLPAPESACHLKWQLPGWETSHPTPAPTGARDCGPHLTPRQPIAQRSQPRHGQFNREACPGHTRPHQQWPLTTEAGQPPFFPGAGNTPGQSGFRGPLGTCRLQRTETGAASPEPWPQLSLNTGSERPGASQPQGPTAGLWPRHGQGGSRRAEGTGHKQSSWPVTWPLGAKCPSTRGRVCLASLCSSNKHKLLPWLCSPRGWLANRCFV